MGADTLDSLAEQLEVLRGDFNKLQRFSRVNYETLTRICQKIEKSPIRDVLKQQDYKSNLTKLTEGCDGFVLSFNPKLDALCKDDASHALDSAGAPETLERPLWGSSVDLFKLFYVLVRAF